MRVLVTGGAGYIGSHAIRALSRRGHQVLVFDNLSTGHSESVGKFPLVAGDLRNRAQLINVFSSYKFDAVMHFAALALVGESVANPGLYYDNNICGGLNLLNMMKEFGVKRLIFSSSAAVYGNPRRTPITEDHPTEPINPYGRTKLMFERMMEDYRASFGLGYASLRYFNAAGASLDGKLGEDHTPESHLIPNVLLAALGRNRDLKVFGNDYPTPDGTCVRDYVHVEDLASAHMLALESLKPGRGEAFNLGSEKGFSVMKVIETARKVTGRNIKVRMAKRRSGDPPVLVASSKKIRKALRWSPEHSDLRTIISTAWEWHKRST